MNITTFTGNLGRDWEQANSNTVIAKNSLAVRRDFKNKQTGEYDTDWIPLTAFSKTAETLMQYTSKGSKILIVGKLQTNNYTDKNGNKRTSYDVIVDRFEFLDSRGDNQQKQTDNPFANANLNNEDPFESNDTEIDNSDSPFYGSGYMKRIHGIQSEIITHKGDEVVLKLYNDIDIEKAKQKAVDGRYLTVLDFYEKDSITDLQRKHYFALIGDYTEYTGTPEQ